MAFLLLISIAFERRLGLVLKALAIKVTSNAPWDHHTFICLLLRSISIKMLHTKMNKKKKPENMQTITSFLAEKTCADWSKTRTTCINRIYNWFVFFTIDPCDICHVGKQKNEIILHYNRFHFPEQINCIVSSSNMAYISGVYWTSINCRLMTRVSWSTGKFQAYLKLAHISKKDEMLFPRLHLVVFSWLFEGFLLIPSKL